MWSDCQWSHGCGSRTTCAHVHSGAESALVLVAILSLRSTLGLRPFELRSCKPGLAGFTPCNRFTQSTLRVSLLLGLRPAEPRSMPFSPPLPAFRAHVSYLTWCSRVFATADRNAEETDRRPAPSKLLSDLRQ